MSPVVALLLAVLLLALNALFVAAEFSLIAARRTQLEPRAAAGSSMARMAIRAMENITQIMAGAQLGITLCSLGLGAVAEPAVAHLFEPLFEALGIPEGLVHPISFALALSIVVFAHVVLGEMVPKNLALVGPDRAALVLGPFMLVVVAGLKPFVVTLNAIANLAVRIVRLEPKDQIGASFTHDEVAGLLEESAREGLLDPEEYGLVAGALEFEARTVGRVLLPLDSLTVVASGSTRAQVEEACARTGFSRFPVCSDSGELVGYLHIKDALEVDEDEPIADAQVRPLATISRDTGLVDALRTMQSRGAHMARVADEDGQVLGVAMLEDVLEELVGEVRDSGRRATTSR